MTKKLRKIKEKQLLKQNTHALLLMKQKNISLALESTQVKVLQSVDAKSKT